MRVKCSPEDTVGDLKKLIAAQTGTAPHKVRTKEKMGGNLEGGGRECCV